MKTAEPYVIRGHHLEPYAEMIAVQQSPAQAARSFRLKVSDNSDSEYVADIVGLDSATIDRTETNLTDAFNRFTRLEPQGLVKITFGEKDAICACCPIGRHCTAGRFHRLDVGPNSRYLSFTDIADMHAIARFKRIAEHLGEQGIIAVNLVRDPGYDETLTGWTYVEGYADAIEYEEPLTITAAVVRSVLSQWGSTTPS